MDYTLQVRQGSRTFGHFRSWALDLAVSEADEVAAISGRRTVVFDVEADRVAYDTETGHANYVPQGAIEHVRRV